MKYVTLNMNCVTLYSCILSIFVISLKHLLIAKRKEKENEHFIYFNPNRGDIIIIAYVFQAKVKRIK